MSNSGAQPLPEGWTIASLHQIATINPRSNGQSSDDSLPVNFVPMRAVAPEGGGLTDPEVRPYGDVKKGYTSFISGDVIMAKITPCMENGKTAVVPALPHEHCFGSTEFHVVRPEGDVQPRWIVNFLLQHETRRTAQRHMTGAVGQMRVPTSFLEDLQIPIAPAREQLRIADVLDELLSDLDAGLEALTRAQTKLALYRSSVLKAAVQGDLTAEWRRQHPYVEPASVLLQHILTERRQQWEHDQLRKFQYASKTPPANWKAKYKQPDAPDTTNLPELPEGWCWVSFDQISDIQGGLQKTPKRVPVENHYPYLRVANVLRGAVDLRELHHFELTNEELNRLRLRVGDLLIVEGNGSRSEIGRCALWAGEIADCVHQNHIIRLRPLDGLHSEYLNLYLNSPVGQTVIQLVASSTSGLYTLSVGKIQKLPVALAPTAEQEQIAEKVAELFSVVEHVQVDLGRKADSVGGLRQSILRQAFTGRLVPQDPSDEPASKLLKLIAEERKARAMKNVSPRKPATKRQKREK